MHGAIPVGRGGGVVDQAREGLDIRRELTGVLTAFRGSAWHAPLAAQGNLVTFAPFEHGTPTGRYETFADPISWLERQLRMQSYRMVGLAEAPDGAVLVNDDSRGRIWRVTYRR